jgi:AcrR family transcriptional regulator
MGHSLSQRVPATRRTKVRGNARQRILDAAVAVAHDVGPAHLSLDAVAERAGVSKGGLLYHFPTKQALLEAIVESHLAAIETAVGITSDGAADDGNAIALGLLRSYCDFSPAKAGGARGFLAAIAETPSLLDPIRKHNIRVVNCLRKAPSSDIALISFLVVEGMRSLELFDSNPLTRSECESILTRLHDRLEADEAPPAPPETA